MEILAFREDPFFYYFPKSHLPIKKKKDGEAPLKVHLGHKSNKLYSLPLEKTARMEIAEKVYWICHLCGRLVWTDSSKRIATTMMEEGTKITIEHALCKGCKMEYFGIE